MPCHVFWIYPKEYHYILDSIAYEHVSTYIISQLNINITMKPRIEQKKK